MTLPLHLGQAPPPLPAVVEETDKFRARNAKAPRVIRVIRRVFNTCGATLSGPADESLMSIGSVALATGIPANTLRTWERRYGFPMPARTEGRQRAYRADVVPHLQLVAAALAAGHRPRYVLNLAIDDLAALTLTHQEQSAAGAYSDWKSIVIALDGPAMEGALRRACAQMGAVPFLVDCVGPFMHWVGDAWESGEITVHNEHFASANVKRVLDDTWRALAPGGTANVICAALADEQHDLGVYMAAVAVAAGGRRPLVLPGSTPVGNVQGAQRDTKAPLVAISLSANVDPNVATRVLTELRQALPPRVALWAGGAGAAIDPINGVKLTSNLVQLADRS